MHCVGRASGNVNAPALVTRLILLVRYFITLPSLAWRRQGSLTAVVHAGSLGALALIGSVARDAGFEQCG